ncbi:MAG: ATP synthase subunit I [Mycobacterium sp.]
MTTPAPDAPLVFPSVVFRPVRLAAVCAGTAAVATAVAGWLGQVMFGVFFGVGLALGLINALLVRRSVASITADAHPLKHKMAVNSATRLLVITAIGLTIAFLFRPPGLGVLFGLAVFQVYLVLSTSLPVWKKIRTGDPDAASRTDTASATDSYFNPASSADNMFKD